MLLHDMLNSLMFFISLPAALGLAQNIKKNQILELLYESLLVVFFMTHRSWSHPNPQATLNRIAENTGFSVLS